MFVLNIEITLPSENFIISDVTWNELYSIPGIRISRFLTPGMYATETVSFVLGEGKKTWMPYVVSSLLWKAFQLLEE